MLTNGSRCLHMLAPRARGTTCTVCGCAPCPTYAPVSLCGAYVGHAVPDRVDDGDRRADEDELHDDLVRVRG
eukprot:scaffold30495_cov71-Phaeocystis_antarctica.AAC.1